MRTFRYLVESGIAPETVAKHCGPRANRAVISVAGEVGRDEFIQLATDARAANGKGFDPVRYFCGDDELLHVGARTYACSSQWGGNDWMDAMTNLRDVFPDRSISFAPDG